MSASNNVEIDPQKQRVTITIAQRGMPYGVIGFFADVLQLQRVSETEQNQTLVLPIARSSPALGNVEVAFTITGTMHCNAAFILCTYLIYILVYVGK